MISLSQFGSPRRNGMPIRARLRNLHGLWRQRRALERLDADRLSDIGISRDQARTEARRPIWDVPATWRD